MYLQKMVTLQFSGFFKKILLLTFLLTSVLNNYAYSLDNPDAPDYIAQFNQRSKVHEKAIDDPDLTNRGIISAYHNYLLFLDKELNSAYKLLRSKLPEAQKNELKKSQQQWIKFRDAEFEFINHNWTRANFGSSYGLSRGGYQTSIIKNRIIQLLYYSMNY